MPHGATGQDLTTHPSPNQGDNFSWRILHLASCRTGAGANATLDTGTDILTAMSSRYLFHKTHTSYYH